MPLFTNHPVMDIEFIDFLLSCLSWSDISTFLLQKLRKGQIPPDGAIQKHRMQHQKSMEPSFEPTRPTPSPREPRQQEPMETQRRQNSCPISYILRNCQRNFYHDLLILVFQGKKIQFLSTKAHFFFILLDLCPKYCDCSLQECSSPAHGVSTQGGECLPPTQAAGWGCPASHIGVSGGQ